MSDTETSIPFRMPLAVDLAIGAACAIPPRGVLVSGFDRQSRFGGLKDGALYFQRCRWCRTPVFRRVFCPSCASENLDLERSAGTGVVRRSLVVRRNDVPYNLSLVLMAEGFVLQGSVVGVECHAVRSGAWVSVNGDAESPSWTVTFRPYGGPAAHLQSVV
ncbi:Zn-ribbon domain-containing OB-fold protein [Streptomyces variegatus]|uniref:Zn-ribbon domain-containing OB-fold protein n=1 Tax=Streptomyces variegatus TaxID=284040 RepID=UPI003C2EDABF